MVRFWIWFHVFYFMYHNITMKVFAFLFRAMFKVLLFICTDSNHLKKCFKINPSPYLNLPTYIYQITRNKTKNFKREKKVSINVHCSVPPRFCKDIYFMQFVAQKTIFSPNLWHYRNKIFCFAVKIQKNLVRLFFFKFKIH